MDEELQENFLVSRTTMKLFAPLEGVVATKDVCRCVFLPVLPQVVYVYGTRRSMYRPSNLSLYRYLHHSLGCLTVDQMTFFKVRCKKASLRSSGEY